MTHVQLQDYFLVPENIRNGNLGSTTANSDQLRNDSNEWRVQPVELIESNGNQKNAISWSSTLCVRSIDTSALIKRVCRE